MARVYYLFESLDIDERVKCAQYEVDELNQLLSFNNRIKFSLDDEHAEVKLPNNDVYEYKNGKLVSICHNIGDVISIFKYDDLDRVKAIYQKNFRNTKICYLRINRDTHGFNGYAISVITCREDWTFYGGFVFFTDNDYNVYESYKVFKDISDTISLTNFTIECFRNTSFKEDFEKELIYTTLSEETKFVFDTSRGWPARLYDNHFKYNQMINSNHYILSLENQLDKSISYKSFKINKIIVFPHYRKISIKWSDNTISNRHTDIEINQNDSNEDVANIEISNGKNSIVIKLRKNIFHIFNFNSENIFNNYNRIIEFFSMIAESLMANSIFSKEQYDEYRIKKIKEEEQKRREEQLEKEKIKKRRQEDIIYNRNCHIKELFDWEEIGVEPFSYTDDKRAVIRKLKELFKYKKDYQWVVLDNIIYCTSFCNNYQTVLEIFRHLKKSKKVSKTTMNRINNKAFLELSLMMDGFRKHENGNKYTYGEIAKLFKEKYGFNEKELEHIFSRYRYSYINFVSNTISEENWVVTGKPKTNEANVPEIYLEEDYDFENDPDWNLDLHEDQDDEKSSFYESDKQSDDSYDSEYNSNISYLLDEFNVFGNSDFSSNLNGGYNDEDN